MNFSNRCHAIGTAYAASCFEEAISACCEDKYWKAIANVSLISVATCVTRIASIAENTIIGLGNIFGSCFSKNCSLFRGVKLLTLGNLVDGSMLVASCCLMPIALIVASLIIPIDMKAYGNALKEDAFYKEIEKASFLSFKEWEKAGMNLSFLCPVF